MRRPEILLQILLAIFAQIACRSAYATLQPVLTAPQPCIDQFQPKFTSQHYRASIDVTGKHLSGILVLKKMPSGNTRVLFTGESGPTFFDFEIGKGSFKVHYCIRKLNKKAVIHTLRRDFEVLLMENIGTPATIIRTDKTALYYPFTHSKETEYYVTDLTCSRLLRAELAGRRKKKVLFTFTEYENGMPGQVIIEHQTFNFVIRLDALHKTEPTQD